MKLIFANSARANTCVTPIPPKKRFSELLLMVVRTGRDCTTTEKTPRQVENLGVKHYRTAGSCWPGQERPRTAPPKLKEIGDGQQAGAKHSGFFSEHRS